MVFMMRERCEQARQCGSGSGRISWLTPIITALLLGAAASWVDFHMDEPIVLCGFVFLFSAACGMAFPPRRAWICALVIAGSLPIYFILGRRLNVRPHWPPAEIHATNW